MGKEPAGPSLPTLLGLAGGSWHTGFFLRLPLAATFAVVLNWVALKEPQSRFPKPYYLHYIPTTQKSGQRFRQLP